MRSEPGGGPALSPGQERGAAAGERPAPRGAGGIAPPLVGGIGPAARSDRADALDAWLARLLPAVPGVALLAVGGLGRRECLARGDLDLILVHGGEQGVARVADAVWYPIWDAGIDLDHAVRTVPEMLAVGRADVKAALGLIDARYVAGDRGMAERVRAAVRVDWRRQAAAHLAELHEITAARWDRFGELAFEPEGDLKEARGGLRDGVVLRGIALAQLVPGPRGAVGEAYRRLLNVREALHARAGRRLDRLVAELTGPVAELLADAGAGLPPADRVVPVGRPTDVTDWRRLDPGLALRAQIADDARTISYATQDAWRSVRRLRGTRTSFGVRRGRVSRRPLDDGVVEQDGEVVLARAALAPERADPALPIRVVAAAARSGLPVAGPTLEWLAASCAAPPVPWPPAVREAFLRLLGSGPGLVEAWEAADRYGLIERWLPEWSAVRNLPQPGPVHRHTVDRHLVQTVVCAAEASRAVSRPDLLLLGALLHDIGKGRGVDHSAAGAAIAERVGARMGLEPGDVAVLGRLVRRHLLLPDTATRRDLADPVTAGAVAEAVDTTDLLDLLAALSVADATAAGPLAASRWRLELIGTLVGRVRATLRTGESPSPSPPAPEVLALAAGPLPAVASTDEMVRVVAPGEPGLLAAVSGCLAAHRLTVRSADVSPLPGSSAVAVECAIGPDFGTGPDPARLAADLRRAVRGEFPVAERLAARERGYPRAGSGAAPPRVVWHDGAATGAVVLELRAADRIGLLYRVARALAGADAWVRSARISTLGASAVDTFYLVGEFTSAARRAAVAEAVLAAAAG
ncbi:[protein-PII] uridylyltransferase [Actinocatenispora thailandica]|uniref:[protein-PII] uridylyltransferase n=1 Tax=Actinocatenispora thailandica TaxID=227318 RepID=UPI0031D5C67A